MGSEVTAPFVQRVVHGGVGEVGSAVFCPLLVHPLLECGVDQGGLGRAEGGLSHSGWGVGFFVDILGREAERVYLSVQQCAN